MHALLSRAMCGFAQMGGLAHTCSQQPAKPLYTNRCSLTATELITWNSMKDDALDTKSLAHVAQFY